MKRILGVLLSIVITCGMLVVPVAAEDFDVLEDYKRSYPQYEDKIVYISAMSEAFDNGYEYWYDGYSLKDAPYDWGNAQLATDMLNSVWWDIKPSDEEAQQIENYYQIGPLYCVYDKELLEEVIKFKFNISVNEIAQKANKDWDNVIIQKDNYWFARSWGRGDRWPESSLSLDSFETLNNNTVYAKWHFTYKTENSDELYAVLEKGTIAGKEFVGYRYFGLTPPSNDILAQYGDSTVKSNDIQVILNGNSLSLSNPPVMRNERVMLPMREVCEKIGAKVTWDGNAQTATAVCNGITVKFIVGNDKIYVDGLERHIGAAVQYINDSLYIPVRALTEAFNDKVYWEEPNTVRINHYDRINITVYLDKKKILIPTAMSGDVPVVSAEDLCEKLGFIYKKIDNKTITIQYGDKLVEITDGEKIWESTGSFQVGISLPNDLGGIPYVKNGKMMIPTHNICEYLGGKEYQNSEFGKTASCEIYLFKPEIKIPQYTASEEYNKYIYEQIKVDTAYAFAEDFDNDGNDETFVFYKKKRSNKLSCVFFDFKENKYTSKSVFEDKSFNDVSFSIEDADGQKVLVMCSNHDYLKLYYGFGIVDGEVVFKALYGNADAALYNTHNDNTYITTDRYDYLDGVKYDYVKNQVNINRLLPQEEGVYWELNLLEVSPDFVKTFKNGEEIYKNHIQNHINNGDKIQVLYAPNSTIYINSKHFDSANNRVENKYYKLWIGSSGQGKLSYGGSGDGNYPAGTFWWWMPTIFVREDDIAYQYVCDTKEYFEDNSTWQTDSKAEGIRDLLIFFNGQKLKLTREIQIENDRTMYPFRECMEFMGAKVEWNPSLQEASAELNGNKVVFKINSNRYIVNGIEKEMDVNAYIDTDATYIPIRYAAEALGYTVKWIPSFEKNVISIGDNSAVSDEIENYVSGYNNLTNTAKIGKGIYDLMKNNHKQQFKNMRDLQFACKDSIEECARAQNCQSSVLDLTTLTVDATIALAKTYSGDVKAGVDFIAGQVTDTAAKYISGAISDFSEITSVDEMVKAMCNSAFDNNLKLIDAMENYYDHFDGKMNNEAYTNFLMLYQCIRQNNRTLKMGVEYFSEDLSADFSKNLAKVFSTVSTHMIKQVIKSELKSTFNLKQNDDIFSALNSADLEYSTGKKILKNTINNIFSAFKDSDSPALRSYGKDMEKLNNDFQDMCLK